MAKTTIITESGSKNDNKKESLDTGRPVSKKEIEVAIDRSTERTFSSILAGCLWSTKNIAKNASNLHIKYRLTDRNECDLLRNIFRPRLWK